MIRSNCFLYLRLTCLCLLLAGGAFKVQAQSISLNGKWMVKLDSGDNHQQSVQLPGVLDDAGIGEKNNISPSLDIATLAHLSRKVQYVGKAWYTRQFIVPLSWKGKQVQLRLGRVLWQSRVWIDGKEIGQVQESLVTPHAFNLSGYITPGRKQNMIICIDNGNIYPGINVYAHEYPSRQSSEMAHAYTNHTQIKWNGILGGVSLIAKPKLSIQEVAVYPDLPSQKIRIHIAVLKDLNKNFGISAYVADARTGLKWSHRYAVKNENKTILEGEIPIEKGAIKWDEFTPSLYKLVTVITSAAGIDSSVINFGIRELAVKDSALHLNAQRIFVRGNLECIIFPKKGYPPMTKAEWAGLFKTAKTYGLNTFRFHSWCPPEPAFAAADEAGFYLHVELPHWSLHVGADTAAFRFLQLEAGRIIKEYGNHPSFLFFSMGNELEGDFSKLNGLVAALKQKDNRHLYTTTTFTFQKEITGAPQKEDEFYVTQWTKKGWIRGQGIFNDKAPEFNSDYSQAISDIPVPVISHEIGQYAVFPDINEIGEYTGNLQAKNFMAVKTDLEKKGLLFLAPAYLKATGKFASILYKEEIERALRTKGFDGFHLLQLQDFPGQGTALVGLLNAFWKSKGAITPEEFRQFCSEVVPLIRFPKAVYSNAEVFKADVELANFFHPFNKAQIVWNIRDEKGVRLAGGQFEEKEFPIGNGLPAGKIEYKLSGITEAKKLSIEVAVKHTPYHNTWNICVYPQTVSDNRGAVVITQSFATAVAALGEGKKVLLCPDPDTLKGITGKFVPVFWSPVHFPDQPGTMGLLINQHHKALSSFPTDFHSDWQWWDLVIKSKTIDIGKLPDDAVIVRVIDNFVRNKNLANLFEVKVGQGSLLFSSIDIVNGLDQRIQARQLRYSLLQYMNSSGFNPVHAMTTDQLRVFFR